MADIHSADFPILNSFVLLPEFSLMNMHHYYNKQTCGLGFEQYSDFQAINSPSNFKTINNLILVIS